MTDVEPTLLKDPLLFPSQDVWVGEHPAVDPKQPIFWVVDHHTLKRNVPHRSSPFLQANPAYP
jgi:hypothetical protein